VSVVSGPNQLLNTAVHCYTLLTKLGPSYFVTALSSLKMTDYDKSVFGGQVKTH
jgi:hypothetical protein